MLSLGGGRVVMLDIVDFISTAVDALGCSWRGLLVGLVTVGIVVLVCWIVPDPWRIPLSILVGLFAIALGIIWERSSLRS